MLDFHDGAPAGLAAACVAKAPTRRVAYATAPNGGGLQYVVDLQAPETEASGCGPGDVGDAVEHVHLPGAFSSTRELEADARLFKAVHGRSYSSVSRC